MYLHIIFSLFGLVYSQNKFEVKFSGTPIGINYPILPVNIDNELIVQIEDGKLEGHYMKTRYGRQIVGFMGVPYAKPPINELRFKDPVPVEPWTEIYKAVNDVPECPQKHQHSSGVIGSEDCLYLNVFTPQLPREGKKSFPVMVFFHRGAWLNGSGKTVLYGPNILLDRDVILVVPNYRLGPLGFLSTQDDIMPGNMGMKDQVLALKWVQKNIAKFGGDQNSVTIFGQSAGAGSVHYHMLSPMSKGLFHRAIANSGTALCPWAVPYREAKQNTIMLAKSLNCPTNNSEEIVKCLRKLDARNITDKITIFEKWNKQPINMFVPIIEHNHPNAFITEQARKIIMEGKINPVSLLTGITSGEGAIDAAPIFENPDILKEFSIDFDNILPITLDLPKVNTKEIKKFYFGEKNITNNSIQEVLNLYTDALFGSCLIETVKLQMKYRTGGIYVYYFDYEGNNSIVEQNGYPPHKYGISHSDDLFYLFPNRVSQFTDKELSNNDSKMADVMTKLWVNFAKTGKPTLDNKNIWKQVETENVEYLHIKNYEDMNMENNLLKERAKFWICLLGKKNNGRYEDCM